MAFLAEQANGKASDGFQRIMEVQPTTLHQRSPFICGSPMMVDDVEAFLCAANK